MASLSYDSPALLRDFAARKGLHYPMLSDPESKVIRAFGILNESMPKGSMAYGVPYPGTYVVDAGGVVRARYFERDATERYTPGAVLVREFGEGRPGATAETRHLKATWFSGDTSVFPGGRTALVVEVEMKPGMHVYAPGVEGGYIPIEWKVDEARDWQAHAAAYPAARRLHLAAIGETVPVYTGRFRLVRDVTIGQGTGGRAVTVTGSLRYQACDERECFPPETIPLRWTFQVEPLDNRRAPAALRRPDARR